MDWPAAHISIPNGPAGGTPMVLISISNGPAGCSYFNPQWTSRWNTRCLDFNLQWTSRLLIFQFQMDQPAAHISTPKGPASGTPTVLISISNGLASCLYFNPQWTSWWNTHCLDFHLQWTGCLFIFHSLMDQPVEH